MREYAQTIECGFNKNQYRTAPITLSTPNYGWDAVDEKMAVRWPEISLLANLKPPNDG